MPKRINRGGRPATGKVRTEQFQLEVSPEEREYLSRKVFALRGTGINISQNGLIVKNTFRRGWRDELDVLRHKQRNEPPKHFWHRKS